MDDLDTTSLIYLEDESSEDERLGESELFKCRYTEGAFSILVVRRFHCNEEKFREYIRLTPFLFDYVLNHIRDQQTSRSYNRHKNPISPEEKLCLFLR